MEKEIFLKEGVPEIVIIENGRQFTGKKLREFFINYRIKKVWYNSLYHPQNNFTERYNRTLNACLRAYSADNHRKWDANIPKIQLALRTAQHTVTAHTVIIARL